MRLLMRVPAASGDLQKETWRPWCLRARRAKKHEVARGPYLRLLQSSDRSPPHTPFGGIQNRGARRERCEDARRRSSPIQSESGMNVVWHSIHLGSRLGNPTYSCVSSLSPLSEGSA